MREVIQGKTPSPSLYMHNFLQQGICKISYGYQKSKEQESSYLPSEDTSYKDTLIKTEKYHLAEHKR